MMALEWTRLSRVPTEEKTFQFESISDWSDSALRSR
jgi:hypothetical protein